MDFFDLSAAGKVSEQKHRARSAIQSDMKRESGGASSSALAGRPSLESWNGECLLAHQLVDGHLEYLVKLRPVWKPLFRVPYESEAEYWNRYQSNESGLPKDSTHSHTRPQESKTGHRSRSGRGRSPTLTLTDVKNPIDSPSPTRTRVDFDGYLENRSSQEDDMFWGTESDGGQSIGEQGYNDQSAGEGEQDSNT
ncbi:hypothetical protein LTR43_011068 [Exophiala xenobiotica]|nr:hypothetical protein LTR14_011241 [Exophiala xenobiotica]KAK5470006.1 hypothetical protein LTR55_011239 [Exophiala xenobiotica]